MMILPARFTLNVPSSLLEKKVIDNGCCLVFESLQNRLRDLIIKRALRNFKTVMLYALIILIALKCAI